MAAVAEHMGIPRAEEARAARNAQHFAAILESPWSGAFEAES